MTTCLWISLYEKYKRVKYSDCEGDRKFAAWTGVVPQVAEKIFQKYNHPQFLPTGTRLLIVLYFLKHMPTEDEASAEFEISSRTTYRKYLWESIEYLDYIMDEVRLDERFSSHYPKSGIFSKYHIDC